MDKFNIYLFVLNFWHSLFQSESLDISNIRIENETNIDLDNSDMPTLSDIEDN